MSLKVRISSSHWVGILVASVVAVSGRPATALDLHPQAAGIEVDLLPTVASSIAGETGGSLQVWAGADRNRLRLVGAHLHYPNDVTADPFADRSTTVAAVIYDRFFRDDFAGPWVAAGAEYWWSEIGLEDAEARGSWNSVVATVGAGWVIPIWKDIYINPWAAAHVPFNTASVAVGTEQYQPKTVEAEVSLKIGWSFDLSR